MTRLARTLLVAFAVPGLAGAQEPARSALADVVLPTGWSIDKGFVNRLAAKVVLDAAARQSGVRLAGPYEVLKAPAAADAALATTLTTLLTPSGWRVGAPSPMGNAPGMWADRAGTRLLLLLAGGEGKAYASVVVAPVVGTPPVVASGSDPAPAPPATPEPPPHPPASGAPPAPRPAPSTGGDTRALALADVGLRYALPSAWEAMTDPEQVQRLQSFVAHALTHRATGVRLWVSAACHACITDRARAVPDLLELLAALEGGNTDVRITRAPSTVTLGGRPVELAAGLVTAARGGTTSAVAVALVPVTPTLGVHLQLIGPPDHATLIGTTIEAIATSLAADGGDGAVATPAPFHGTWLRANNTGGRVGQGGNNTEERWTFRADGSYRYYYASSTYMPGVSIEPTVNDVSGRWFSRAPGRLLLFDGTFGTGRRVAVRREGPLLFVDDVRFIPVR